MMKRILIILAETSFVIALFFASGVVLNNTADAYYNKSKSFSKGYTFDRWRDWMDDRRRISSGTVSLNHYAGMTKGDYTVNIGNEVDFSHWENMTYVANGGGWDTPYGNFCGGINTNCFGDITEKQRVEDDVSDNYAYVHWTGVDPGGYITSSNSNVVSCTLRYSEVRNNNTGAREWDCVAKQPGTARITITANDAQTRFWGYVRFWWQNAPNWMWLSEHVWGDLNTSSNSSTVSNKMTISGGTVGYWDITVRSPIVGACNPDKARTYAATDTAASTNWATTPYCSAGSGILTPPAAPGFPNEGQTVTWTCKGTNGGSNGPTCSATRTSAPVAYNCLGADPINATICPSDNMGLTANVAKTISSFCSSPEGSNPKCQFTCNSGYELGTDSFGNPACNLIPSCGNGILDTGEACDFGLGNNIVCPVPGYKSSLPAATCQDCLSNCQDLVTKTGSVCGDYTIDSGNEDCDDGNNIDDGNGCSADCQDNSSSNQDITNWIEVPAN